jgi:hypothetical protein
VGINHVVDNAGGWKQNYNEQQNYILTNISGQKHYPVKYNLRSIFVFTSIALFLYFLSTLYAGVDNKVIKLILNNLLLLIFTFLFYKLEYDNLKKIKQLV